MPWWHFEKPDPEERDEGVLRKWEGEDGRGADIGEATSEWGLGGRLGRVHRGKGQVGKARWKQAGKAVGGFRGDTPRQVSFFSHHPPFTVFLRPRYGRWKFPG